MPVKVFNQQKLIEFREKNKIGIEKMAHRVGMPKISYIRIETGVREPDLQELRYIALGIGVRMAELLNE